MTLRVGSLFAGIGGWDLGLERAGMKIEWFCEQDPFCQRVLRKHWPDVPGFCDIREIGAGSVPPIDVLCGGFPCQDISSAGKGAGLEGERSGLWFEFERLIGELRPRWVLVENVQLLRSRGLDVIAKGLARLGHDAEWDVVRASDVGAPHQRARMWIVAYPAGGMDRRVFGDGILDAVLRACHPGGEWALAHADGLAASAHGGPQDLAGAPGAVESLGPERERRGDASDYRGPALADAARDVRTERAPGGPLGDDAHGPCDAVSDASGGGRHEGLGDVRAGEPDALGRRERVRADVADAAEPGRPARPLSGLQGELREARAEEWPAAAGCGSSCGGAAEGLAEPGLGRGPHGISQGLDGPGFTGVTSWLDGSWEHGVPRVAEGVKDRPARLRALGNALVPVIAEVIGRRIVEYEHEHGN